MEYQSFEFDEAKSAVNKRKHGIDFVAAQEMRVDERLLRIEARCLEERRYVFVGVIGTKHWSAIVTYRDERIRLISVRRSRDAEVCAYESE
ncbi:MAG: BrnT family toxin [Coriobacteriia bacterium]|nr:BrnT family toxin [Coriobacteriia bacterium]